MTANLRIKEATQTTCLVRVYEWTGGVCVNRLNVTYLASTVSQYEGRLIAIGGLLSLSANEQGRRHAVDWHGHVHPTFAKGCS